MAAWSAILILSGFEYDGPRKRVVARPKQTGTRFQSFWSCASGWGTFTRTARQFTISVDRGSLACTTLDLEAPARFAGRVTARAQAPVEVRAERKGSVVTIVLDREVVIHAGESLTVTL
jgi:hypothetical protein